MLEELNALLEEAAKLPEQNFDTIPDGSYEGIIDGAEFTESKNTGNLMFKWTLKYTTEEIAGRFDWKYQVLNSAENMKRLTTDLSKFGIDCSSIKKIQDQLEDLLDVEVAIVVKSTESKKTGEIYRNISISPLK